MYGAGNDIDHSVSLTDAGYPTEYLDSGSIDTSDVRAKVWRQRRAAMPAAVLDLAERFIEEYEDVPVSISAGIIDLSKTDTAGYAAFEELFPGTQYRIIDAVLAIDETVWLKSIEYDMQNPMAASPEFTRNASDMGSYVGEIAQQLVQPFTVEDSGIQNPRIARVFPSSYSAPEGFAYKDLDFVNNSGVCEWHRAADGKRMPLGVWVPYDGV
jgi:hypothetical protein